MKIYLDIDETIFYNTLEEKDGVMQLKHYPAKQLF